MKIKTIVCGYFKLDGGAMFGVVPKVIWNKLNPADENNLCTWAMRLLYIEKGDKKILVDTGIGNKQSEKFYSHFYPSGDYVLRDCLLKNNISPEDITDVILTHLHFDHVGGALIKKESSEVPALPYAKYWTHKTHFDWAVKSNPREKASFLKENFIPLKELDVLYLLEGDDIIRWDSEISFIVVNGHTEGMILPVINMHNQTFLYCADLIPSTSHLRIPYVMAYDMKPMATLEEKQRILKIAISQKWKLIFEHDPKVAGATIKYSEKGRVAINEIFETLDLDFT